MLTSLSLKNFLLADSLELSFHRGFGVLTGETGAGKSLLIDALQTVTGGRSDTSLVRKGANKADVVAVFCPTVATFNNTIGPLFEEWMIDNDSADDAQEVEILLRRVIEANGRSKAFINGVQVTVQQLRLLGEQLIDIHGQHESFMLTKPTIQREIVDDYANCKDLVQRVDSLWHAWADAKHALDKALNEQSSLEQQRELLELRARDLELVLPAAQLADINARHLRLTHVQSLQQNIGAILNLLEESESNITDELTRAQSALGQIINLDRQVLEPVEAMLESAHNEVVEATRSLRDYAETLEDDPHALEEVEATLRLMHDLSRKFRVRPETLEQLRDETMAALSNMAGAMDVNALAEKVKQTEEAYFIAAKQLSEKRRLAAQALSKLVSDRLPDLGMKSGKFRAELIPYGEGAQSAGGLEAVEFQVSGLAGGQWRALAKVASGGELSRIALALFVCTHQSDKNPKNPLSSNTMKTFIFDEVDAGIGGAVADTVGQMLRELSEGGTINAANTSEKKTRITQRGQILCITHLPQVAVCAHWHARVEKIAPDINSQTSAEQVEQAMATSRVTMLEENDRVEEIARMLGGRMITETTRSHAKEMLAHYL